MRVAPIHPIPAAPPQNVEYALSECFVCSRRFFYFWHDVVWLLQQKSQFSSVVAHVMSFSALSLSESGNQTSVLLSFVYRILRYKIVRRAGSSCFVHVSSNFFFLEEKVCVRQPKGEQTTAWHNIIKQI